MSLKLIRYHSFFSCNHLLILAGSLNLILRETTTQVLAVVVVAVEVIMVIGISTAVRLRCSRFSVVLYRTPHGNLC